MYFSSYNPTLHDLYLYDASNTGTPTGLNPNCILYDCSNCYSSISVRPRSFSVLVQTVPPGTPTSMLANYYNAGAPLFAVKSDKIISVALHYMANLPSDSQTGAVKVRAKYTGLSGPNAITSINFWKNDYSGLTSYGPWTSSYNCVPTQLAPESSEFQIPIYFTGSPEVPGFSTGATFYKIAANDYAFMDLLPANQQMTQTKMQHIHPYALLTEYQKNNIEEYRGSYNVLTSTSITYNIPTTDVYIWDGNDKIIPVQYIQFNYYTENPTSGTNGVMEGGSLLFVWALVSTGKGGVGDSSSQFLYKSGNTFYSFGQALTTGTFTVNGATYGALGGPVTAGSFYPTYQYLENKNMNQNHYRFSNNAGLTLATNPLFQNVNSLLDNIITTMQNKYNEFTG